MCSSDLTASASTIYKDFNATPPPPKAVLRRPELPLEVIWGRIWRPRFMMEEADLAFRLLHNILPVRGRLARFGVGPGAHCPRCPGVTEDTAHAFIRCPRVGQVWEELVGRLLPAVGPQADEDLLLFAWTATEIGRAHV